VFHVAEKFLVEVSAGIVLEAVAMVCTVHLPSGAEALAGRTSNNQIDLFGSNQSGEFQGRESSEILLKRMWDVLEICPEDLNGLVIEINCGEAFQTSAFKAQAEATAATKEIEKGVGGAHWNETKWGVQYLGILQRQGKWFSGAVMASNAGDGMAWFFPKLEAGVGQRWGEGGLFWRFSNGLELSRNPPPPPPPHSIRSRVESPWGEEIRSSKSEIRNGRRRTLNIEHRTSNVPLNDE
jgi:hypothetical protein